MIDSAFVPIVLFICVTYAVVAFFNSRTRRHMISQGVSEDLVQSILREDELRHRLGSLRWGIVLVALAIGFAIIQAQGWNELNAGLIAVLAAATGIGNLAYFAASRWLGSKAHS